MQKAVSIALACLVLACCASVARAEESSDEKANKELVGRIEILEQKLRDRTINIEQFQKEFREIEGLPSGWRTERVLEAKTTKELRSALDSLKSDLVPTPWWVTALIVIGVILLVLFVIAAIATGDPFVFLWIFLIFSGDGGSDF